MATPGCNPSLLPESHPSLTETPLELKKKELNKHFERLHETLRVKQSKILASLESSVGPTGYEYDQLNSQLQQLYASKLSLEQTLRNPSLSNISNTLQNSLNSLKKEIEKLEMKLNPEEVSLVWKMEECESAIEKVCQIKSKTDSKYKSANQPLWYGGSKGTGRCEMRQPKYLAVDPSTSNIYILDYGCLHIYNEKGEHLSRLPLPNLSNLVHLTYINGYVYIIGYTQQYFNMTKINPIIGRAYSIESISKNCLRDERRSFDICKQGIIDINDFTAFAIMQSTSDSSYICIFIYNKVYHLIIPDCICIDNCFHRRASWPHRGANGFLLKSPYIKDGSTAISMCARSVTSESIHLYLLFEQCECCVQVFNLEGVLVRAVGQLGTMNSLRAFAVDNQKNIIISQVKVPIAQLATPGTVSSSTVTTATTINIYSNSGELQHAITYSTEGIKYDYNSAEKLYLCVNSMYRLTLLNPNQHNNILQII